MKKAYLVFNISLLMFSVLFSSCEKQTEAACEIEYGGRRPGLVILELRDAQDRDLLNPITPGHYDTTEIKALNTVTVIDKGKEPILGNSDRIKLMMYFNSGGSLKLKLSNTVTDEMIATYTYPVIGCNPVETITSFTYNGTPYTPWEKQYNHFIIKR